MGPDHKNNKIAVVGSGIAGLSAAWLLGRNNMVTLFEKEARLGGHANTVDIETPQGRLPVDTGFIVYNSLNYPNLTALFEHLNVRTEASDMSFAASIDDGTFEYSGCGLDGLLGQRRNLANPRLWRMARDILRFYREAPRLFQEAQNIDQSLGDFLDQENYSPAFINDHILPMAGAIWSASAKDMLSYPLAAFVRFFESHGLLKLKDRPQWRTVSGGSRSYVSKLLDDFNGRICHDPVIAVKREQQGVTIATQSGASQHFDHIVIAAHADTALSLLTDPSDSEEQLLSQFKYTTNHAVLHSDAKQMPRERRVWASWNYIEQGDADEDAALCVTYWMNRLQNLDSGDPVFVTLNPQGEIDPALVHRSFTYEHPLFDRSALKAQRELWSLQGNQNTWFCGSYFGYGFHEDALQSGLAVGEILGGTRRPWQVTGQNNRLSLPDPRLPKFAD